MFEEFLNKNYLNNISNFQPSKNLSLFLFHFFFFILIHQYSFSYLSCPYHILSHIFSLAQSIIQPNRTFDLLTQFSLAIFDL
jgi:hypothetical protein